MLPQLGARYEYTSFVASYFSFWVAAVNRWEQNNESLIPLYIKLDNVSGMI